MRRERMTIAAALGVVLAAGAGAAVPAAVDVRASGIKLAVGEAGLVVTPRVGVWAEPGESDFQLRATLRHRRGEELVAVLWETEQPANLQGSERCQPDCRDQSCTGPCWVGPTQGKCEIMVRNCQGLENRNECLCNIKGGGVLVISQPGDLFELEVRAIGATDADPTNDVVRVSVD